MAENALFFALFIDVFVKIVLGMQEEENGALSSPPIFFRDVGKNLNELIDHRYHKENRLSNVLFFRNTEVCSAHTVFMGDSIT